MPKSQMKTKKQTKKQTSKSGSTRKSKKQVRPSPSESATSLPTGSIRRGGNGNQWVIVPASNGVARWVPIENAEINGVRLLTVNHLAKNIGRPVVYYSREYNDTFPTVGELAKMVNAEFTPNGNAQVDRKKKLLENWLQTQKPPVQPGQMFMLLGTNGVGRDYELQVDSKHPQHVSDNVMNTECFVKVK